MIFFNKGRGSAALKRLREIRIHPGVAGQDAVIKKTFGGLVRIAFLKANRRGRFRTADPLHVKQVLYP